MSVLILSFVVQVDVLSEDEGEIMMLVPPDAVVSTSQLQENV